jgi:hypothetical protein
MYSMKAECSARTAIATMIATLAFLLAGWANAAPAQTPAAKCSFEVSNGNQIIRCGK